MVTFVRNGDLISLRYIEYGVGHKNKARLFNGFLTIV